MILALVGATKIIMQKFDLAKHREFLNLFGANFLTSIPVHYLYQMYGRGVLPDSVRNWFSGKPTASLPSGKKSGTLYRKRKRYRGKRRYRKKRRRRSYRGTRQVAQLRKQVRTLQRRVQAGLGTYVYKRMASASVSAADKAVQVGSYEASNVSKIQGAIDALPVYDPTTGVLTPTDFNSGTIQKQVEIAKTFSRVTCRNNYEKPCKVTIYLCSPKSDTSLNPVTTIDNGLSDVGSSLSRSTIMIYPTDSSQFKDLWKIRKRTSRFLMPGRSVRLTNFCRSFMYDTSFEDSHGLQFQSRWYAHVYMIRVEGVPAHGATSGEGSSNAKVDCLFETHYTIKYDAGADIYRIEVDDNQTMTGSSVVALPDVEKNSAL